MLVISASAQDKVARNIQYSAKGVPNSGVHALIALGSLWEGQRKVLRAADRLPMMTKVLLGTSKDHSLSWTLQTPH